MPYVQPRTHVHKQYSTGFHNGKPAVFKYTQGVVGNFSNQEFVSSHPTSEAAQTEANRLNNLYPGKVTTSPGYTIPDDQVGLPWEA
jgi:hypothetical protein